MGHSAERDAPLRCRIFGHRWEQDTAADGSWWFLCRRCGRCEQEALTRVTPPAQPGADR